MTMNKREFLAGTTVLGLSSLVGTTTVPAAESTGFRSASVYNVLDFGAKGDGKTPDSEAIQKALDAAGAVSGTVYFPAGRYLCHDLKVHPHTTVLAEPQWGYRGEGGRDAAPGFGGGGLSCSISPALSARACAGCSCRDGAEPRNPSTAFS